MQARKQGSIVNISSSTILKANTTRIHYVASKAAVMGFSRVLARELGPDSVRVNTLAPGSTLGEADPSDEIVQMRTATITGRSLARLERPTIWSARRSIICRTSVGSLPAG
ncbi:MAG: putative short-chain dehydrogenase/reductase [Chloroflexi bacterium]|nr:putative short-chain dehydrogenase/reductase [Chloroflexota bacterium]